MKTNLCIPRLRSGNNKNKSTNLNPAMTMLERFREAVFRLIMLSALSKNAAGVQQSQTVYVSSRSCYYDAAADPHHSEAVAECIEFIKKKAGNDEEEDEDKDEHRGSSDSRGSSASDGHCMDANST